MRKARQTGKTSWTSFWTVISLSFPEIKDEIEELWKKYVMETGDFSVDGFLKHMEILDD